MTSMLLMFVGSPGLAADYKTNLPSWSKYNKADAPKAAHH